MCPFPKVVALGGTNNAFRALPSWHAGAAWWRICAQEKPGSALEWAEWAEWAADLLALSFIAWCGLLRVGPQVLSRPVPGLCAGSFPGMLFSRCMTSVMVQPRVLAEVTLERHGTGHDVGWALLGPEMRVGR